jgi:hypothetical protein
MPKMLTSLLCPEKPEKSELVHRLCMNTSSGQRSRENGPLF